MKRGDFTPWGQAQEVTKWREDIFFVSTPSHGGFMLADTAYSELVSRVGEPTLWLNGKQNGFWCFEEDCDAVKVARAFPEIFEKKGN